MEHIYIDKEDLPLIRESCRQYHSKLLKRRKEEMTKFSRDVLNDNIEQLEKIIFVFNEKISAKRL